MKQTNWIGSDSGAENELRFKYIMNRCLGFRACFLCALFVAPQAWGNSADWPSHPNHPKLWPAALLGYLLAMRNISMQKGIVARHQAPGFRLGLLNGFS